MKISVIGGGNMGGALAGGLIASGIVDAKDVMISDLSSERLESWKIKGTETSYNNLDAESFGDIIILAVKPNIMEKVLGELEGFEDKIYISIAAGVTVATLEKHLGKKAKVVRAMPNTPALVGCGMTVLTPNDNLTPEDKELITNVFKSVGEVVFLDEKYMSAACALHGSSPAYIYMLIDAMADGGVKYGLPKDIALMLAAKAVEGSARMVLESDEHPEKLKDNVCSPGGTTIAAVHKLNETGFCSSIQAAIDACVKRSEEMTK